MSRLGKHSILSVTVSTFMLVAMYLVVLSLTTTVCAGSEPGNLLLNGGFERGEQGWMWEQWAGKSLPGYVDRDDMSEGLASFKMTVSQNSGTRYFAVEAKPIESSQPYMLSFDLKLENVPENTARIRLQIPGHGWLHTPEKMPDLVKTGGNMDWQHYVFPIPANKLKTADHVTFFLYHDAIDQGVIGLDNVEIRPAQPNEKLEIEKPSTKVPRQSQDEPKTESESENINGTSNIPNGGFQDAIKGWMYEQWAGKTIPGEVVRGQAPQGNTWFKFGDRSEKKSRYLAKEILIPNTQKDWLITYQIKSQDIPEAAARVRLQIPGKGWLHTKEKYPDQLRVSGTNDWQKHNIELPAKILDGQEKVILFFYHDHPDKGWIGIDDVQLISAEKVPEDLVVFQSAQGQLATPTFKESQPCVLVKDGQSSLAIHVTPSKAIYRPGDLKSIILQRSHNVSGNLTWKLCDGFGEVLQEKAVGTDEDQAQIPVPQGPGYYEVIGMLQQDNVTRAQVRQSIGVFPSVPQPQGNEPFGLWIQGREYYGQLGVTWTREGLFYGSVIADPEGYLAYQRKQFDKFRSQGIKVLAYPKGQPTEFKTGREIMVDTPEAWASLEKHWTRIVRELAGHVDAWGVINEPMSTFWEGTNEMIIKYWALMREIVDQYDPQTPLLGPSLNPLTPKHIAQYQQLLDMGFGEFIDGIEVHTYTPSPEDNGLISATNRFVEMTRQATGKTLPVWVTEMGVSATYPQELEQAQFTARSWLLAKRANYPMMIWHMFSWPQGKDLREVNFGTWRNYKTSGNAPPQPRPAAVAFGVITSQLTNAKYRTSLDHLGPSIHAFVFERDGEAMLALWTTSHKTYDVELTVDHDLITETDLFGKQTILENHEGIIDVQVSRSPIFLSPMPDYYLNTRPLASVQQSLTILPGGKASGQLIIHNPEQKQALVTVEWLNREGWQVASSKKEWTLSPFAQLQESIMVTAPQQIALGPYQIYGKVFLNGKYVASVPVPVEVCAPVKIKDMHPCFTAEGLAGVRLTLRRQSSVVNEAQVHLKSGSMQKRVSFSEDQEKVVLPFPSGSNTELLPVTAIVESQGIIDSTDAWLSFVPVAYRPELSHDRFIGVQDAHWLPFQTQDEPSNIAWAWDKENLYVCVFVNDTVHKQEKEPFNAWQQDSVQIGISAFDKKQLIREPNVGLQEADYVEIDVSLDHEAKVRLYRHRTVNQHVAPLGLVAHDDISVAVRRKDGQTQYELAIPASQLGLKEFAAGQVLKAAVLVNDADEEGGGIERQKRMWFNGIASSKDPDDFGHLVLLSPEVHPR